MPGVTARTLRHHDEIGPPPPSGTGSKGLAAYQRGAIEAHVTARPG
ncbi:hypothetical protein GCM10010433_20690 [Streptomyces pulveraceus]